jgi:small-conductance mechanosensitive channel/CRP-like cAMP-binding protein
MQTAGEALLPLSQVLNLGAVLAACAAIIIFARRERTAALRIFGLYLAAIVLRIASIVAHGLGYRESAKVLLLLDRVLVGVVLLNLAVLFFFAVVLRPLHFEPPRLARDLMLALGYIAVAFYLLLIYGFDVAGLIATSAVITAVIGFSLQEVLGNVMGGLALQLDRSIVAGDMVRIGDVHGVVRDINWRRVSIESLDGDLHIVPNSKFVQEQVTVTGKRWNGPVQQRRSVFFQIEMDFAPARVIETIANALAHGVPDVAAEPKPDVVMVDIEGNTCKYAVRYWLTRLTDAESVESVIRSRVMFALKRGGLALSPKMSDVVIHRPQSADEPIAERTKALRAVSILSSLTEAEMTELAERLVLTPFTRGETIIVQGDAVDHLYILTRGTVEVRIAVDGASKAVTKISAPSFFGEMGMLTGELRTATIVALDDVDCWRLDSGAFAEILEARIQIADDVCAALAERLVEHAAAKEGLSEEAKRLRKQTEQRSLVRRIYSFFDLKEA